MSSEQEQKQSISNPKYDEFKSLLDEDFKERKLKENEIIKATVTEITKNFIVVDCKAKMEGMIPIEEFKNDDELSKLKIHTKIVRNRDQNRGPQKKIAIHRSFILKNATIIQVSSYSFCL